MTNYSFVLDADGKPLSPTKEVKAWYMIRKGKATLVSKYPMTIQLKRVIPTDEICKDEVRLGGHNGVNDRFSSRSRSRSKGLRAKRFLP